MRGQKCPKCPRMHHLKRNLPNFLGETPKTPLNGEGIFCQAYVLMAQWLIIIIGSIDANCPPAPALPQHQSLAVCVSTTAIHPVSKFAEILTTKKTWHRNTVITFTDCEFGVIYFFLSDEPENPLSESDNHRI